MDWLVSEWYGGVLVGLAFTLTGLTLNTISLIVWPLPPVVLRPSGIYLCMIAAGINFTRWIAPPGELDEHVIRFAGLLIGQFVAAVFLSGVLFATDNMWAENQTKARWMAYSLVSLVGVGILTGTQMTWFST